MEKSGSVCLRLSKSASEVTIALLTGAMGICAGQASASPIAIDNFSFERPEAHASASTFGCPAGWVCSFVPAAVGVYSPTGAQYPGGNSTQGRADPVDAPSYAPGGSDALFVRAVPRLFFDPNLSETRLTQATGELIRGGVTYTLDVWIGHQLNFAWGNATIQLLADGMLLATSGVLSDPGEGNWSKYTLSFSPVANDLHIGQRLGIALTAGGVAGGADFDLVSLLAQESVSVPEPSSILLLGAGLLAVGAACGRRRLR